MPSSNASLLSAAKTRESVLDRFFESTMNSLGKIFTIIEKIQYATVKYETFALENFHAMKALIEQETEEMRSVLYVNWRSSYLNLRTSADLNKLMSEAFSSPLSPEA